MSREPEEFSSGSLLGLWVVVGVFFGAAWGLTALSVWLQCRGTNGDCIPLLSLPIFVGANAGALFATIRVWRSGRAADVRRCPNGHNLKSDWKFCMICGQAGDD